MDLDEDNIYEITMSKRDFKDFINNLSSMTENEILAKLPQVYKYYFSSYYDEKIIFREYMEEVFKFVEKLTAIKALFSYADKFISYNKIIDFPKMLKYGVEIEVVNISIVEIQNIFKYGIAQYIFEALEVPRPIASLIIQNTVFTKKSNVPDKWIFSKETADNESEASSPIMHNELNDLNQINAICLLFKTLGGELRGDTGLHINIGVDYFECNEKAIEYLLKLWGECEELFFKVANAEGEIIRTNAKQAATPIKENIQEFFENDGSITLNTEEDFVKFLYQIQARHNMDRLINYIWYDLGNEYDYLETDYDRAETEDEKLKIYREYHQATIKEKVDNPVRWTSINFNHMKWNDEEPGRIEFRIFNSSLDIKTIIEDLVLVGKMEVDS